MSVPSWKQKQSKTKFIWETYLLNVELGRRLNNKFPKKYKTNYIDHIINSGLEALRLLNEGNDIKLFSKYITEDDFLHRKRCFVKARSLVDDVGIVAGIFYELCVENKEVSNDKFLKDAEYIGGQVDTICELITDTLYSDTRKWTDRIKRQNEEEKLKEKFFEKEIF